MLTFTSCQSPLAEDAFHTIVDYLAARLPVPVRYVGDLPWAERLAAFDAGEIDVCWLCGLQYVWRARGEGQEAGGKGQGAGGAIALLASPVLAGPRYADRPIYFSEVVVRSASPYRSFADLRRASWAYNEPTSHSGCYVARAHLARLGERAGYFGRVVESGAHQLSLALILKGEVDAAAIDSTVLAAWREQQPALGQQVRSIATLGPSSYPPWAIRSHVPEPVRNTVRQLLVNMQNDPVGRAVLQLGHYARFATVDDQDYNDIRQMAQLAEEVSW